MFEVKLQSQNMLRLFMMIFKIKKW